MKHRRDTRSAHGGKRALRGMHVVSLPRRFGREQFITAVPVAGETAEAMLDRIAAVLRDAGGRIVSQDVYGVWDSETEAVRMLSKVFGRSSWPVTWIEQRCGPARGVGGIQTWAVAGVPAEPLEVDGRLVGTVFEDDYARYCRLGNLLPTDPSQSRNRQAWDVLEQMERALRAAGFEFQHVLRTWFRNDDILSW